jgi:hypothetical protein
LLQLTISFDVAVRLPQKIWLAVRRDVNSDLTNVAFATASGICHTPPRRCHRGIWQVTADPAGIIPAADSVSIGQNANWI